MNAETDAGNCSVAKLAAMERTVQQQLGNRILSRRAVEKGGSSAGHRLCLNTSKDKRYERMLLCVNTSNDKRYERMFL
ncbi:MAG: hypothetical protein WAX04_02310 [Oscillospiraceae bacterium]